MFNRKKLAITTDFNTQVEIRRILAGNNIDYRLVPFSMSVNMAKPEYKFYVRRKDYEEAAFLIREVYSDSHITW